MCNSRCWWKRDNRIVELVRGHVFSSARQRWCLGLMSLDKRHYKQLIEMQCVGVWQHILSFFKSHRGTIQQATLRAVLVVATSLSHSAFFNLLYLLLTADNGTSIIFNPFEHFHSFSIRSSVKNLSDRFPSFEALHLCFTRPTDQLPPTESSNALDFFFPVAWHVVSWSYFFIAICICIYYLSFDPYRIQYPWIWK